MIVVHGPWPVAPGDPDRAPNWLPCCEQLIRYAVPGLVSCDPDAVTCQGDPLLRELMANMLQPVSENASAVWPSRFVRRGPLPQTGPGWPLEPILDRPPDPRIGVRLLALLVPALQFWEHDGRMYFTTGTWLTLDAGTLDLGIVRDFSFGFGDRWRPWKRHLHRLGPRVWRLFGWRPRPPDLDIHLVRDSKATTSNDYSLFAEECERPAWLRWQFVPSSEQQKELPGGY